MENESVFLTKERVQHLAINGKNDSDEGDDG